MTKEIERAARALIKEILECKGCQSRASDFKSFKDLEKALDPKPSREEVISRLQNYNDWRRGAEHSDGRTPDPKKLGKTIDYAIELLQEPQKGVWIENTGDIPKYKTALLKFDDGDYIVACEGDLEWNWKRVVKYMIIE